MGRELKFRTFYKGMTDYSDEWTNLAEFFDYYKGRTAAWDRMMQYTGLKDKNGVQVYEDDILMYQGGGTEPDWPVHVQWNNELAGFYIFSEPHDYWEPVDGNDSKFYEVIGNIYEDKELLQ